MTPAKTNEAIKLYESGQSCNQIAAKFGISPDTVRVAIKDAGVKLDAHRYKSKRRIPADPDIIQRYRNGESVWALSQSSGLSRTVINRWITEAGLDVRTTSEAGKIRASKMTPAERAAQATAANAAARGATRSAASKLATARTIAEQAASGTRKRSPLELQLGHWLNERGVNFVPEQVVDIYNVDFGINNSVAVELLGGAWHSRPSRADHHRRRTHDILNAGWHMIFVWSTTPAPINPWAADKIVTLLKEAGRLPAAPGQYWVIRGDGELMSTGSGKSDNFTLELPHHRNVRLWP